MRKNSRVLRKTQGFWEKTQGFWEKTQEFWEKTQGISLKTQESANSELANIAENCPKKKAWLYPPRVEADFKRCILCHAMLLRKTAWIDPNQHESMLIFLPFMFFCLCLFMVLNVTLLAFWCKKFAGIPHQIPGAICGLLLGKKE